MLHCRGFYSFTSDRDSVRCKFQLFVFDSQKHGIQNDSYFYPLQHRYWHFQAPHWLENESTMKTRLIHNIWQLHIPPKVSCWYMLYSNSHIMISFMEQYIVQHYIYYPMKLIITWPLLCLDIQWGWNCVSTIKGVCQKVCSNGHIYCTSIIVYWLTIWC